VRRKLKAPLSAALKKRLLVGGSSGYPGNPRTFRRAAKSIHGKVLEKHEVELQFAPDDPRREWTRIELGGGPGPWDKQKLAEERRAAKAAELARLQEVRDHAGLLMAEAADAARQADANRAAAALRRRRLAQRQEERNKALAQLMPKQMQAKAKPKSFIGRLERKAVSLPNSASAPSLGLGAREAGAPDVATPMGTLGEKTTDFLANRREYLAYTIPN